MTRKELLDRLNNFEAQYPVNQWEVNGIQMWPIIKIDTFFKFIEFEDQGKNIKKSTFEETKVKKAFKTLLSLFSLLKLILKPSDKKPKVLFSESRTYRFNYDNQFINRYFQPMKEYLEKEDKTVGYLFINDDVNYASYTQSESILFLNKYVYASKLRRLLKRKKEDIKLPYFDQFLNEFKDESLKINRKNFKGTIVQKANWINEVRYLTDLIIRKNNIIGIFELCYYATSRYALNISAKKKKIPVFEIQHGGMGLEHPSYSSWFHAPQNGYQIMPQTFWLWDEGSFELIEGWTKKQQFHKAILGGNPWTGFLLENKNDAFSFPEDKKIILYTLQHTEIEEYILETIKNTSDNYQWWIRLHPRKQEGKTQILKRLDARHLTDKVEIEKANNYPLPVLLLHTDIHVSGYSGSIIEAAQLGVMSLILEPLGVSYFKTFVNQGMAVPELSQSADCLLDKIMQYSNQKSDYSFKIHKRYKAILADMINNQK